MEDFVHKEPSPSFGWSNFALRRHHKGSGNTYSTKSPEEILKLVEKSWHKRQPGDGETAVDRKVVVPVDPSTFYCSSVLLNEKMERAWLNPLRCKVRRRQKGEDLFASISVRKFLAFIQGLKIKPEVARYAKVVLYSREALLENGGTADTSCDWEVVCLLASPEEKEPMHFLTMARNMLEKPGGTKSTYSAEEFAESIYYWSQRVRL